VATWIQAHGAKRLGSPQWAVRGETALGLGILLCVAVLTQLPPPKAAASARPVTTLRADAGGLRADLTIASPKGLLAPSDLSVRIQQADGHPSEGVTRVTLQPSMPGMEMNLAPIVGTPAERGEYRARTLFSMLGVWEIAVKVRRKGVEEDALFRFPFIVVNISAGQTELGPSLPERLSLRAAWSTATTLSQLVRGTALVVLGLAGCLLARRWRRGYLYLIALPFLLVGGHQTVNAMVIDATPTAWHTNPIPADSQSLASGRALYMANCATCHGETGRAEGLMAIRQPSPSFRGADLTGEHMEAHSDGDLFWWIGKGIPGTAMPGFEASLEPEERWRVVTFIRSLRDRASARPEASR
jgi:mono/diheme cytochrome c family protein